MKVKSLNFILFLYFFIAFVFLYFVGYDSLDGLNNIQFFADSQTYEMIYKDGLYNETGILSVSSNFLGPVLILELTSGNRWLVFIINCFSLYVVFYLVKDCRIVNYKMFFFLLLLNPLTFQSLLSVNKEVFSILVSVLLFLWMYRKKTIYIVFALVLSLLVRWQLTLLLVALIPAVLFFNSGVFKRVFISFLFIIALSIFFKFFSFVFNPVISNFNNSVHLHDGSGFFVILNNLQISGYFLFIWMLKFLQMSFGLSVNLFNIFNFNNFQNDVVMVLSSINYLLVFLYGFKLKVYSFKNPLFIAFLFIAVFFSLSLIFSPRYFYFVFVFLMLMVSIKRNSNFD